MLHFHIIQSLKLGKVIVVASAIGIVLSAIAQPFNPVQQPPGSQTAPGNVLLTLSTEFPTAVQESYNNQNYTPATDYSGYFDNRKCYRYSTVTELFTPSSGHIAGRACPTATHWSGNYLNYATMTNLDQFRSVLTGGTRDTFSAMAATTPGDSTVTTVLIRSFSDRNSYSSSRPIAGIPGIPPQAGAVGPTVNGGLMISSGANGSKFLVVRDTGTVANYLSAAARNTSCAGIGAFPTDALICYNVRVVACKAVPVVGAAPAVGLEPNCNSGYSYVNTAGAVIPVNKPEGLMQQYTQKLRFGAMGYLNDSDQARNGGVLRSQMNSLHGVEWNLTTGILATNPYPADATASGVPNSGSINYLNKFGYAAGSYKGYDPLSELYYAAQLYFRNRPFPADYTSGLNASSIDGFPAITTPADPIINACQKNFILGIGDIYTWCDGNLPGSTSGVCSAGLPVDPDGLNVETLWGRVKLLEGVGGFVGGAGSSTGYIAGLAHWANTQDIRPDLAGKQTIQTYMVDVLENTNGQSTVAAASLLKTQYWLAAKYGGFKTSMVPGDNPNVDSASWDKNSRGIPDTWYAGNDANGLRTGLSQAFSDIADASAAGSASTAAVSSRRQTASTQIIYAGYEPKDWAGTLRACGPNQEQTDCISNPTWEASRWLNNSYTAGATPKLTNLNRKIFTSWRSGASLTSSPFQWANLNTTQTLSLNSTDGLGQRRLDFLRGSRVDEGGVFRARGASVLGDIANSGVVYVAGGGVPLIGPRFAGHAAYRALNRARPPVAYVGANDGMLHAFDAANIASAGKELFGYIPSTVFPNLNRLTARPFTHTYFIDSTPMVGDVQYGPTATPSWRTILVGGLGGGGKGYYALNITNQAGFAAASEASLASGLPMWDFTATQDSDIGYSFNEPSLDSTTGQNLQITQTPVNGTADGQWNVIVGNGYGSTNGLAYLYFLDANTGAVNLKLAAGSLTGNGLSTPTPYDSDGDGLVDTIYAGDLKGQLHKFQYSQPSGSDFVLATPLASQPAAQWRYIGVVLNTGEPITVAPTVSQACGTTAGIVVSVGSGKLSEASDPADVAGRSFYTVFDTEPSSGLTVPLASLAPIAYTDSINSDGIPVRDWAAPNLAGKKGWKMPFVGGERILSNATLPPDTKAVLFGSTKPNTDTCGSGGTGYVMAANICTGASGELNLNGNTTGGYGLSGGGVVKVSGTYTDSNNQQGVTTNQKTPLPPCPVGAVCPPPCPPGKVCPCPPGQVCVPTTGAPKGRYSWREILTK
jgi:type IV pilus assembly protein PilY1